MASFPLVGVQGRFNSDLQRLAEYLWQQVVGGTTRPAYCCFSRRRASATSHNKIFQVAVGDKQELPRSHHRRETDTLTEDQDGAEHEPEGVEVIGERGQIAKGGGSGRIGGGGGHGGRRVRVCAKNRGVCVVRREARRRKKKKGGRTHTGFSWYPGLKNQRIAPTVLKTY